LQILYGFDQKPSEAVSPHTFINEGIPFGLQDPPSLAGLGSLDATNTDVFEEGGLRNSQVLTGFLCR
jgi:hypothetical protein